MNLFNMKKGFTLLELLISIILIGILVPTIYSTISTLQESNITIKDHLNKTKKEMKVFNTLFIDLLSSDAKLKINKKNKDYHSFCMKSNNTIYLSEKATVCWGVLRENNQLFRVEGNFIDLNLIEEKLFEVDLLVKNIENFNIIQNKDNILVHIKEKNKNTVSFIVQIKKFEKIKVKKKNPQKEIEKVINSK